MKTTVVWEGVTMDSLKYLLGPPCPTFLRLVGGRPAAVFYPFGHPMAYTYGENQGIMGPGWVDPRKKLIVPFLTRFGPLSTSIRL
jgi:hypothetical protein